MTKQHRATTEQWESIKRYAEHNTYDACILELCARIEALESTQSPSPSPDRMLALQDQIRDGALTLADAVKEIAAAPIRFGPESPLVERVADAIILEVAAWLCEQASEPGPVGKWLGQIATPFEVMADMLRNEANR